MSKFKPHARPQQKMRGPVGIPINGCVKHRTINSVLIFKSLFLTPWFYIIIDLLSSIQNANAG